MANEAVLQYETEQPIPFTVTNATGIEKGALLKFSDPITAAISNGAGDIVAGIAAKEKIASDGNTKLAVYMGGVFKATASGTVTAGDPVAFDGSQGSNNLIYSVVTSVTMSGVRVAGYALETAANGETFLFRLHPTPLTEVRE